MINISLLLAVVAACCFVLACWGVRQNSRESVLANLVLILAFGIAAVVLHPIHKAHIEANNAEVAKARTAAEVERLAKIRAVLDSAELAVRYIEATGQNSAN